jgi:hypothetical protein
MYIDSFGKLNSERHPSEMPDANTSLQPWIAPEAPCPALVDWSGNSELEFSGNVRYSQLK